MSSAAVQTSGPALSNRQYQQSPHSRDQYYAQQSPNVSTSPSSSRKPSRRPSGNGASPHTPTTPQQRLSPSGSNTSNMTTPRGQPLPPSTHASPIIPTQTTLAYNSAGGPPIAPPPRSSSNNRIQADAPSSSHTQLPVRSADDRASSSRNIQQQGAEYNNVSERERERDDTATAAASAAQSRRRAHASPKESPQQQHHGGSSRARPAPAHSRSATAVGSPPVGTSLPREESIVIDRLIVADPQEDIAREQARMAESIPATSDADITPITGLGLVGSEGVDDGGRGAGRSRQDHSRSDRSRKETKFGDYILGQTLGEGEFGKVKMGWKKDGGIQVAIKLIRKDTLGTNNSRRDKINREITILRGLQHPNIVRLHEKVETERHIGIILEYASGGELFDYILNHRYLKDNAARRLFAQLVSGVGYLHKKGIVHRDLKLENLLLDRNRNIIITDFGFANTFNPSDELGEEVEYNLGNKDFVKQMNLEALGPDGHRRGDLMQTSCGSPCYAAPELVVSDSLYTGRKVDVWSCGVILYAMLAGYLPFDDDPANPEGDNINLLYKYIVSTPLTFPEYVTPHARDLLKRILVPDPRKRADLFEVARHSWLSEYAHVVGFITSSTTTPNDIANTTVTTDEFEAPHLARSASVREPGKSHTAVSPVGGLTNKHGGIDAEQAERSRRERETKRRTVQVEYVAPQSQTARGEASPPTAPSSATVTAVQGTPKTRVRTENQGPVEVPPIDAYSTSRRPSAVQQTMAPTTRPGRDSSRSVSESAFAPAALTSNTRPSTGGTMSGGSRLPSRGNSYGQPAVATVATTNAQGRFSQPKGKQYTISAPIPQKEQMIGEPSIGRPSTQRMPSNYQQPLPAEQTSGRGHKRSSTVSETIGRFFTGRPSQDQGQPKQKSYPPTSMTAPIPNDNDAPRQSTESSRRTSFGFSRKNSESTGGRSSRRFSLLPASLSRTFTGGSKEQVPPASSYSTDPRRPNQPPPPRSRGYSRPQMAFGQGQSRSPSQSTTNSTTIPVLYDNQLDSRPRDPSSRNAVPTSAPAQQTQFSMPAYPAYPTRTSEKYMNNDPYYQHPNDSEASEPPVVPMVHRPQYPAGFNSYENPQSDRRGVLQKSRKFADAYDAEQRHSGSSGSAKRVMDIFRRIGKQRVKEDR